MTFSGCVFSNLSSAYQLERTLRDCWQKEKLLLRQVEVAQNKKSIARLQQQTVKIKKELEKAKSLLKKVAREKSLPKSEIDKRKESLLLLSETAEDINSFLVFELSSKEESRILSEVSWRLTLLSGKLSRGFKLISKGKFEEAEREIERAKAELISCRELINQVRPELLLSLDEVSSYLDKLEVLVTTAESFIKDKGISEEDRKKVEGQTKELFSTSLEALSLREINRDELVKQASLRLEKAGRSLGIQ